MFYMYNLHLKLKILFPVQPDSGILRAVRQLPRSHGRDVPPSRGEPAGSVIAASL